jgi:hypothetical protein
LCGKRHGCYFARRLKIGIAARRRAEIAMRDVRVDVDREVWPAEEQAEVEDRREKEEQRTSAAVRESPASTAPEQARIQNEERERQRDVRGNHLHKLAPIRRISHDRNAGNVHLETVEIDRALKKIHRDVQSAARKPRPNHQREVPLDAFTPAAAHHP